MTTTQKIEGRVFARVCLSVVICLLLLLEAATALCDDKAEAEAHFKSGVSLLKVEDFKGAAVEFRRSIDLYPTKSAYFNYANCMKVLHKYHDALKTLKRLKELYRGQLTDDMEKAIAATEKEIAQITGRLEINVNPDGATVQIDGENVGMSPLTGDFALGPGEHEVSVALEGYEAQKQTVSILAMDKKQLSFLLTPPTPQEPPRPAEMTVSEETAGETPEETPIIDKKEPRISALSWVAMAGTVVFGAATGVFFGLASSEEGHFKTEEKEYEKLKQTDQTKLSPEQMTQFKLDADDEWNDMDDPRSKTKLYVGLAWGSAALTGLFAIGTIVSLMSDFKGGEGEDNQVSASPRGLTVMF